MADLLLVLYCYGGLLYIALMFSFLFRDNIGFRIANLTLLGATVANFTLVALQNIYSSGIIPLIKGNYLIFAPIIFGFSLIIFGTISKLRWIYRYPVAIMLGVGTGLALRSTTDAQITGLIRKTIMPLGTLDPLALFNAILMLVAVIASIYYFVFGTIRGKVGKILQPISTLGRIMIMVCFGASCVSTILTNFTDASGLAFQVINLLKLNVAL